MKEVVVSTLKKTVYNTFVLIKDLHGQEYLNFLVGRQSRIQELIELVFEVLEYIRKSVHGMLYVSLIRLCNEMQDIKTLQYDSKYKHIKILFVNQLVSKKIYNDSLRTQGQLQVQRLAGLGIERFKTKS
ncbi:hypothetical protein MBANPS3_004139 [Mucor bainieri]